MKADHSWQNRINNAVGQTFEKNILRGCQDYKEQGRAKIEKTPEPFRVTQTHRDGRFTGRFTAHADPDFKGTLAGGRSIVFESKYTTTDKLKRGVVTSTQLEILAEHDKMGALAAVVAGMQDEFYFIPFHIWRDMKEIFGRQYLTAEDIELYRIKFNGSVLFLDRINHRGKVEDWYE